MVMDITHILERAVRFFPQAPACVAGARRLTYDAFYERVGRLAHALQQCGVTPGARVAVLSANSVPYLEMYYATAWLGAVIVPLNMRLAAAELAYIINDSGSTARLVGEGYETLYGATQPHVTTVTTVLSSTTGEVPAGMLHYEECLASVRTACPPAAVDEDDL